MKSENLTEVKTGVLIPNMRNDVYHADRKYISSSGLKLVNNRVEEFYKKYVLNIREPLSEALVVGNYVHSLVLEPHTIDDEYKPCEFNRGTLKFKAFEKEWEATHTVISYKEMDQANYLASQLLSNIQFRNKIEGGLYEHSLFGEINGVHQKIKLDVMVPGSHILDIKTTKEPLSKFSIDRIIESHGHGFSAAMYINLVNTLLPPELHVKEYYLGFVSKLTGQAVVRKLRQSELDESHYYYILALENLKFYRESGDLDPLDENQILE